MSCRSVKPYVLSVCLSQNSFFNWKIHSFVIYPYCFFFFFFFFLWTVLKLLKAFSSYNVVSSGEAELGFKSSVYENTSVAFLSFFLTTWLFVVALLGLCCFAWLCLRCVGAPPRHSAQASRCSGFSCCRVRALECQLQSLWAQALVALRHVRSSWTRDLTCAPWIGRRILILLDHEGSPKCYLCRKTKGRQLNLRS